MCHIINYLTKKTCLPFQLVKPDQAHPNTNLGQINLSAGVNEDVWLLQHHKQPHDILVDSILAFNVNKMCVCVVFLHM